MAGAWNMRRMPAFILQVLVVACAGAQEITSTLATFGYDRSREGITRCLTDMVWTPEREAVFEQCLADLDSDAFTTRDAATVTLMMMAALPHERLELASRLPGITPEKRHRILRVLDYNTALRRELLLYLAAGSITAEGHTGLGEHLLDAADSTPVTQRAVWDAARTAMVRTAVAEEAPALRRGTTMPGPMARALACEGLAAVAGRAAIADLRPLLADADPRVRFHAALVFRGLQSPDCVPAFISLLDTSLPEAYQKHDTHIRFNSVEILKKLTGQRFGYRAGHAPEVRRAHIQQWETWFKENGATATLDFEGASVTNATGINGHDRRLAAA